MQNVFTSGAQHGRTPRLDVWGLARRKRKRRPRRALGASHPPFLQRKRVLPWDVLYEGIGWHGRRVGQKTTGRPGLPWDVALAVLLIGLKLVQPLNAGAMAVYGSAMSWPGGPGQPGARPGGDESKVVRLQGAQAWGCAEARLLSSETTAQEVPLGEPNAPGSLRGAQRGGRALAQLNTHAVGGRYGTHAWPTIRRTVKELHRFAKGKQDKRQVWMRVRTEGGPWVGQTRRLVQGHGERRDRGPPHAMPPRTPRPEVAKRLIPQLVPWLPRGSGPGPNDARRCDAGAGAPQGGVRGGVGSVVSPEPGRRWGYLWDHEARRGGRGKEALAGAGGIPRQGLLPSLSI
jgi:hypothetical protein